MDRLEEYFLGVIWGDGCPSPSGINYSSGRIDIHLDSREIRWRDALIDLIKKCFNKVPGLYYHKDCNELTLKVYSREWYLFYKQYKEKGLWIKPEKINYPEEVVAGLIDTDGSVWLSKRQKSGYWSRGMAMSSKYYNNIAIFRDLVEKLNIEHGKIRRVYSKGYGGTWCYKVAFNGLKNFILIQERIPLRNPYKADKLKQMLNSYGLYRNRNNLNPYIEIEWRKLFGREL